MLISHVFRGREVDIDITDKREPYEWIFYNEPDLKDIELTDAEENEIFQLIYNTLYDQALA